jgi:hypothetical protein
MIGFSIPRGSSIDWVNSVIKNRNITEDKISVASIGDLISFNTVAERLEYWGKWCTKNNEWILLKEALHVQYWAKNKKWKKSTWQILPIGTTVLPVGYEKDVYLEKYPELILAKKFKLPWIYTSYEIKVDALYTPGPILLPKAIDKEFGQVSAHARILELLYAIEPDVFEILEHLLSRQKQNFIRQILNG